MAAAGSDSMVTSPRLRRAVSACGLAGSWEIQSARPSGSVPAHEL